MDDKGKKDNVAPNSEDEANENKVTKPYNAGKNQKRDLKAVQDQAHDFEINKIVEKVIGQYIER